MHCPQRGIANRTTIPVHGEVISTIVAAFLGNLLAFGEVTEIFEIGGVPEHASLFLNLGRDATELASEVGLVKKTIFTIASTCALQKGIRDAS